MLPPLARDLRLKAERALATARELQDRDPDGSVNRSYYAMFDIARAALLSAGVREDELPRTHSGLIGSFSKHAVLSGRIDQKLFAALGRTESLRLIADYTGAAKAAGHSKSLPLMRRLPLPAAPECGKSLFRLTSLSPKLTLYWTLWSLI